MWGKSDISYACLKKGVFMVRLNQSWDKIMTLLDHAWLYGMRSSAER